MEITFRALGAVEYWGYIGWEAHFEMMQTVDKLNNGVENNYAYGVGIGSFEGIKSVGHGGAIGGFRANVITYPDKELSIVILTNFSMSSVGQRSNAISEILLGKTSESDEVSALNPVETIKLSKNKLASYEGSFWNDPVNTTRKIYLRDDTLRDFNMKVIIPDVLEAEWPFVLSKFERNAEDQITGIRVSNGRVKDLWFEKKNR